MCGKSAVNQSCLVFGVRKLTDQKVDTSISVRFDLFSASQMGAPRICKHASECKTHFQ